MNKLTSIFVLLILAAPLLNAVNADFRTTSGGTNDWKFDTDMQITTSFTLSLVNGSVQSGNPSDIHNGDTICSGSTLRVTPTVNSNYALSSLDVIAGYPACGGGYCPAMISDGSGISTNRPIKWLSSSTWNDNYNFMTVGGNDFTQDASSGGRFDGLGGDSSFSTQPVTYTQTPGVYVSAQEGGTGVFCTGSFQATDGATTLGSSAMPSSSPVDFAVSSTGSHAISTSVSGVQCFAAELKHPEERGTHPEYFFVSMYGANLPSISSGSTKSTVNINVQNSGGMCAMHETSVSAQGSISSSDDVIVHVVMHNDGDAIVVNGVTGSNSGYTVMAVPIATCSLLFGPFCPSDNGFNESISPGGNKDLYVWVHNNGGASGGTTLTFNAQTVSASCGGPSTCSTGVPLTGPITCGITPPSLNLGTLEIGHFTVQCLDLANNPIACVGNNWNWGGGLTGDFLSNSNTEAYAYTTSPPGSSGTLNYQSGIAMCLSNVNAKVPNSECQFIPTAATMNTTTTKYFQLSCFLTGSPVLPTTASYDTINGLGGSTSNSTTVGTDFTAPGAPATGELRGAGYFTGISPYIPGAVALAPINVVNGTGGNGTNSTNGTCTGNCSGPDGPGSTGYCTIGNGPLNVFPDYSGWLSIMCGQSANETCANVTWSVNPPSSANVTGTNLGVTFRIGNQSGEIIAVVDSHGNGCYKPFFVGQPTCEQES